MPSRRTDDVVAAPSAAALVDRYRRNRARSRDLFALLSDNAYYSRPITLRHPIVFYEGHLPGFSFNTLVKKASGGSSLDANLEKLFARGIDPGEGADRGQTPGNRRQNPVGPWPSRDVVQTFAAEADARVIEALDRADLDSPAVAEAAFAILEHEEMHQETLLYMWHRLPLDQKRAPAGYSPRTEGAVPAREWIDVPAGTATLGVDRETVPFGWDNEFPATTAFVPAFAIDRHDVTNARFMHFVDAGGYRDEQWWAPEDWRWLQNERMSHPLFWEREGDAWLWRGMFARVPLPMSWPVYVSQAEASAFARWSGARLMTEAEFQRAALGSPALSEPGVQAESKGPALSEPGVQGESKGPALSEPGVQGESKGVFDFVSWDPEPAGSHPAGASAWGVEDLVGNGWEWTSTPFAPFPGFRPMASYPEYSADFFDGEHFVMKGASPVTARELIRPTFRNWFRARYPYVYATFRCVRTL